MAPTTHLGLRELHKTDKLQRIAQAARSLFLSKGYDETTTREIAVRAGVAIGTVFIYAANKRDLLFLIMNDELEAIATKIERAARPDRPFLDNLMGSFGLLYRFFSQDPVLSRVVLREMFFYDSSMQARRYLAVRQRMIQLAVNMVEAAQERGEIAPTVDPAHVGQVLFAIFQVELRRWIAAEGPTLSVKAGLSDLRRCWELLIAGIGSDRSRPKRAKSRK